ncbi:MAG: isocitrate/isopropylmalate dehydrogenase family protein [Pseudomonadota bacterium]
MSDPFKIVVFEGDGIGPEIMRPTVSILKHLQKQSSGYTLDFQVRPAGAAHYKKTGESLPQASLKAAEESDAILLSAMGLPDIRYPDGTEISPQIELRKAFNLYAGVRPVTVRDGRHCPIIRPNGERIDFVIIRESTEGLFFSMGKGEVSHEEARETLCITRKTSEKLFDFAFELARQRKEASLGPGTVTCVDKANVFRAFAFFRSIFNERAQSFGDIEATHAYVDATALWMVQKPWMFDVLVTENMFGDILSDLGAGLMGGLGLAPSADIGDKQAVFQPCHGSAPDIAGKNCANPFAMILSAAMMLDWLGHRHNNPDMVSDASRLRNGVEAVLAAGKTLTPDLGGTATTSQMGTAVLATLGA